MGTTIRHIGIIVVLTCLGSFAWGQDSCRWRLAFWNVENFFDIHHDTLKNDYAFTPAGDNHWTHKRYLHKRNNIYKVLMDMSCPEVVGLAEIENDHVLRELCLATPLRRFHYQFIHYESPDQRGVDCALLYRDDRFKVIDSYPINLSDSTDDFYTRDILLVHGVINCNGITDSCLLLVNHWPSKLGGPTADRHRLRIAHLLLCTMDSLQQSHPQSLVLAMGDFNAAAQEEAINLGMEFFGKETNSRGIHNLTHRLPNCSYKYQDTWSTIDQVFANKKLPVEIFAPDYLLVEDKRYLGTKPFRTYSGMRYQGGYSDHLPVIVNIP